MSDNESLLFLFMYLLQFEDDFQLITTRLINWQLLLLSNKPSSLLSYVKENKLNDIKELLLLL